MHLYLRVGSFAHAVGVKGAVLMTENDEKDLIMDLFRPNKQKRR